MKHLFTVFLFTILSFQTIAQRNFKPGYIVSLSGDTTKGSVDYKEWNQNPRDITFKTSDQAASQQYSPDNIKGFGVDQFEHYQRYIGPITKDAVDLADLSSGIDTSFITDNVFLRVITGGKNVTLFSYADKIKTRYFITDRNLAPVELKRYVYKPSGKIREYNFYIQQLLAFATKYAPGDAALTESINRARYRATDLEAVILQLNGNTNKYNISSEGRGSVDFFIGVGVNVLNASFFETEKFAAIENIFTAKTNVLSVGPAIAGGMNVYFNKNVKKLLFRAEVNLTMNNLRATYNGYYMDNINKIDREEELTFTQTALALNPQIVYNIYNTDNLKFFVAAGFQLNLSSFSNMHYYGTSTWNGQPAGKQDKQVLYKKFTTNITAKTGVMLANKFDIYFGYGLPVEVTNHGNYGIDLSYYRFGVNYLLGKK